MKASVLPRFDIGTWMPELPAVKLAASWPTQEGLGAVFGVVLIVSMLLASAPADLILRPFLRQVDLFYRLRDGTLIKLRSVLCRYGIRIIYRDEMRPETQRPKVLIRRLSNQRRPWYRRILKRVGVKYRSVGERVADREGFEPSLPD